MITGLKLLKVYKKTPEKAYLRIIEKTLKTAARLQGQNVNLNSGEKPGKIIHEYREDGYSHLSRRPYNWYIYPGHTLRNYDSVDATPLFLILAAEYYNTTQDGNLLQNLLPNVKKAFNYLENFSPKRGNKLFLEYQLHRTGNHGGLVNQGWMDSVDSVLINRKPPRQPMALVEVQGYYFKALKLWSSVFKSIDDRGFSVKLDSKANNLKEEFNKLFIMKTHDLYYFAQALFAQEAIILEVRSNPGHCLWAAVENNGKLESIIEDKYVSDIVKRLMEPDLFTESGGIRTLSSESSFFDPFSYHNGSVWPFDNGIIAEGFDNFGFGREAERIRQAVLRGVNKFATPVELYCVDIDGKIKEYIEKNGHFGAHKQAWTAATILDFTT